jgi:hypothetical protein
MDNILEYEQDFAKKGQGSKFGGAEYGINKGPKDFKGNQLESLKSELQKYDISESRRYDLLKEMSNLNSIEYMNMKYLASVLAFLDFIGGLKYENEEEFSEIISEFFMDKEFIKFYLFKIINLEKEKDSKYMKEVKIIFYSYLYKVWVNRYYKYNL